MRMTFIIGLPNALMDGKPVPSFWIKCINYVALKAKC
jgi:hypothetical protein